MLDDTVLKNMIREVKESVKKNHKDPARLGQDIEQSLWDMITRHPDVSDAAEEQRECLEKATRMYWEED